MTEYPLIAFHLYAQLNSDRVIRLGEEICNILDNSIQRDLRIDSSSFLLAYDKYWFWVLGAYEVLRILAQHQECFSSEIGNRLPMLTKKVKKLRIPFAKLEYSGNHGKIVRNENSVAGVCDKKRDFYFLVKSEQLWARKMIDEVKELLKSIQLANIKESIELNIK